MKIERGNYEEENHNSFPSSNIIVYGRLRCEETGRRLLQYDPGLHPPVVAARELWNISVSRRRYEQLSAIRYQLSVAGRAALTRRLPGGSE